MGSRVGVLDAEGEIGDISVVGAVAQRGDFQRLEVEGCRIGADEGFPVQRALHPQIGRARARRCIAIRTETTVIWASVIVHSVVIKGETAAEWLPVDGGKPAGQLVRRQGAGHRLAVVVQIYFDELGADGQVAVAAAAGVDRAGANRAEGECARATVARRDSRFPIAFAPVDLHLHVLDQTRCDALDIG